MYSNYKRIGCFMLVLVLFFCVLANPMIQPKAQAVAGAAVVAGVGALTIIVYLLGALGITASSKGTIHQLAEGVAGEISKADPTLFSWLNEQVISNTASGQPIWSPIFTGVSSSVMVSKLVMWVMKIVGKNKAATGETTVDVVDPNLGVFGDVKFTYKTSFASAEEAYSYCFYSDKIYNELNPLVLTLNNVQYMYCFRSISSMAGEGNAQFPWSVFPNKNINNLGNEFYYSFHHFLDRRFGFSYYTYNNISYLVPFFSVGVFDSSGILHYYYMFDSYLPPDARSNAIPISGVGVNVNPVTESIDYQELISYELAEMRLGLTEKLNEILAAVGSISIPMDEPYSDVVEGKEERDKERDGIPYVPGIPVTDWVKIWEQLKLGEKVTAKDPAIPIQQEQDLDVQTLPDVRDKFPFCVPFDLIALVGALNATAVSPKWDIPFKIDRLGVNEKITLDLTQFETVAAVVRWATTITFILGLILITRKLIQA